MVLLYVIGKKGIFKIKGYIYKITNLITLKLYVGQTTNPDARWKKHKSLASQSQSITYKSHLYNSMNKYGVDNFTFDIIEECNYNELDERERHWINELNSLEPNGYNITPGGVTLCGEDNPFYGKHHTEKAKLLISKKNTGRVITDDEREMRRKINSGECNPFYGKHHKEETKKKIIESSIKSGNYQKSSERMKINNPNDGSMFRKPVVMLNAEYELLDAFESATEAGNYMKVLKKTSAQMPGNSISDVCRGKQKSAFGFLWQYIKPVLVDSIYDKAIGYIIKK